MRERLSKFIEMERLTSSRLAEILGVQPSNISHILGGRNKPSFEFIEKLLLRFPKLNPDWIILGKGPVYRPEIPSAVRSTEIPEPETDLNLFSDTTTAIRSQQHDAPEKFLPASDVQDPVKENYTASIPSVHADINEVPESEIDRIILLMKDKSCICYRPK